MPMAVEHGTVDPMTRAKIFPKGAESVTKEHAYIYSKS